jgi:thiamine monophosphate synthase
VSRLNNSSRGLVLCYVTDRHRLVAAESGETKETLLLKIETAAAAGIDWTQIREKDLSGKECSLLTREALQRAANSAPGKAAPMRILVNDRLDVALSQRAGGVHLGEKSLPLVEARQLVESHG